jgi:hypothetical protein
VKTQESEESWNDKSFDAVEKHFTAQMWAKNFPRHFSIRVFTQSVVGPEGGERVSQLAWCGGGCFDSRRRVNSTVMLLRLWR